MRAIPPGRAVLVVLALLAGCDEADETPPPVATTAPEKSEAPEEVATATAPPAAAALDPARFVLAPGATHAGVTRHPPRVTHEGRDTDDPSVAVTTDGVVAVAAVLRRAGAELISVRTVEPRTGVPATPGVRAWHPRLEAGRSGELWLAWCGRMEAPERGDHARDVFLRRVFPQPLGPVIAVSTSSKARDCDPDLSVAEDGTLHVAWEHDRHIAYRAISAAGVPLGPVQILSSGILDRRPAVLATPEGVHVAWDTLGDDGPTGDVDPDYDVLLRTHTGTGFGPVITVDASPAIQAAPSLARGKEGSLLVAYHTSERHRLVKWWALRRVTNGVVDELSDTDASSLVLPSGAQQGAEMPAIAVLPSGGVALATRSSQGALLHLAGDRGVLPALDLTRRGWGARGLRMDVALAPDGALLVARRGRHNVVLERFTFAGDPLGPPRFAPARATIDGRAPPAELGVTSGSTIAPGFEGTRVFFGDVHMHSGFSDGTGPPDEIYARARARGLHFAALTDHDFVAGSRMMLSEHDEIAWITDAFDALPGFVALHAFEWTTPALPTGSGHRNVYFRGHGPVRLMGSQDGFPATPQLHHALLGEDAFTAPHHTGWTGTDWEHADPRVQRQLEIVSVHGAFEDPNTQPLPARGVRRGMFAVDGLKRGRRFGFIGGSDAHGLLWHHGVGRRMDPWGHGLTGAIATSGERGAIWDALFARRTFATSGARMSLFSSAAGAVQGGEVHAGRAPQIRWDVRGTEPLRALVIVRDGEIVHQRELHGTSDRGSWTDTTAARGRHSYYVRAHQGFGIEGTDVVWSSPVFVKLERER